MRQNVTTTVSVNVEITNSASGASGNDILAVNSGGNFLLQLQLSDVDMAVTTDTLNLDTIAVTADMPADLQQPLAVTNVITISATADVVIPRSNCLNVHYLCVLLSEGVDASYYDTDPTDNVMCKNIDLQKACDPGKFFTFQAIICLNTFLKLSSQKSIKMDKIIEHFG